MTTAVHRDKFVVTHGRQILHELQATCASLLHATVLTDDGFEVAGLDDTSTDGDTFASMASSMQALGDAVARELRIGDSDFIIIASKKGHVVQLRVPNHPLVLSALFDDHESLAKALVLSRSAAEQLAQVLQREVA